VLNSDQWFTEICSEQGTAFSLKTAALLHEEQSRYQKIQIFQTESFGNLMVIDGFIMLSTRDNFIYHEMMAHPAIAYHGHAQRVLIVGGGDCGTLREALKHDTVSEVVQVEIDERVTRLAESYFPELTSSNGDPRANLQFTDAIKWVEEAPAGHYDVIIIDSTDPVGPAEGLFQQSFYRACYQALSDEGILVHQSESPLFHTNLINDMHEAMYQAGLKDIKLLLFPQCVYPSGWWSATLAARPGKLRPPENTGCAFETDYFSAGTLMAAGQIPPFVMNNMKRVLNNGPIDTSDHEAHKTRRSL